ncbi:MAG: DUF4838 domain-containing protein [Kiritimatiellae bacterium]|nr:DUF4838 domain-containing protein [Kiritimatiellia bacterium]
MCRFKMKSSGFSNWRYGAIFALFVCCAGVAFAGKPIALIGFYTDVKAIKGEVTDPCRYASEEFIDRWLAPSEYGKYSVLYFGEKLRGEAQDKNWREGEARAAAEKFVADGGTVIVATIGALNELFGKQDPKHPDPLRAKVILIPRSLGRTWVNFEKSGTPISFADDEGNDILTEAGRELKALREEFQAAFAKAKDIEIRPEGEKWEVVPLGAPGELKLPDRFAKRPQLGKAAPRKDGLTLLDGSVKAVIALGTAGKEVRKLAVELAWHLEKMSGVRFEVVDGEPATGPALVYRTLRCPDGFARGSAAYFKIWREGDKVYLGGEDTGKSRATTYVLEALGCRYIWPGESGKIIPRREKIVLPEIAVEDATPFVIRKMRLYGWPEFPDHLGNRDFWNWHGINDMKFMSTDRPGAADGYGWGHYYGDYYPTYKDQKPHLFALQPDGTRVLRIGVSMERPTFCLSNPELAEITVRRKIEEANENPSRKAISLCLPDGGTSSPCMCENCRKLDPVNAPKSRFTVFFPIRKSIPYVSLTDRVFDYMNRVAAGIAAVKPNLLLSTYAYSTYTMPPVKTAPHPNLLILSVVGNYSNARSFGEVEKNLAAWSSFGNKTLWRPNAHRGFGVNAPDNFARRMFADISLLAENGIFGFDYDTMSSDWATKPFVYYLTTKAHFNPDRLDFDTIADDYCRTGFGAAAAEVRAYFEAVERASEAGAVANAADREPTLGWTQRVRRQNRLLEALDFAVLDAHLAKARKAAAGDETVLKRIARLQFGTDVGKFTTRLRIGHPDWPGDAEKVSFRKMTEAYLAQDPAAFNASRLEYK